MCWLKIDEFRENGKTNPQEENKQIDIHTQTTLCVLVTFSLSSRKIGRLEKRQ